MRSVLRDVPDVFCKSLVHVFYNVLPLFVVRSLRLNCFFFFKFLSSTIKVPLAVTVTVYYIRSHWCLHSIEFVRFQFSFFNKKLN